MRDRIRAGWPNVPRTLIALTLSAAPVTAQEISSDNDLPKLSRPVVLFNRWQEDWSVLAEPALNTELLDHLKYIPLSSTDPKSYLSFGANLRERYESVDAPSFGVGQASQSYWIERLELDADLHPNAHWQLFAQLEDDRFFGNATITPVDADPLDLEQAFLAYRTALLGGELKIRIGRQEFGFDLQRFVSVRDGPNVRQAFDAAWIDWEGKLWKVISFWSHPVEYRHEQLFDDYSNGRFQYGGLRVERKDVGLGAVSAYYSRYDFDAAHFLFATGNERRHIGDIRYAGAADGFDWDLEAMGQTGHVGEKRVRAGSIGLLSGYTLREVPWSPRFGLQGDVTSGNSQPHANTLGTFNPLFPNGYYLTLSGFTGDTNLLHLKPSTSINPTRRLKVMEAVGLLWRETTADAVYVMPDIPMPGTAGHGGRWTGLYDQVIVTYAFDSHVSGTVEADHYAVGTAVRSVGGHDSDYIGVELKFGW